MRETTFFLLRDEPFAHKSCHTFSYGMLFVDNIM